MNHDSFQNVLAKQTRSLASNSPNRLSQRKLFSACFLQWFARKNHSLSTQRGSLNTETAIILPLLVAIGLAVALGARIGWARTQINDAAQAGARAASMQTSSGAAVRVAEQAARENLEAVSLSCGSLLVNVEASGLDLAAGSRNAVSVNINCRLSLDDVSVLGLPGSITVSGSAVEQIDSFKARGHS